jgi:hypothetical protein
MKSMKRMISGIIVVAFVMFTMSSFVFAAGKTIKSITIPKATIKIDGKFSDWSKVKTTYKFDTDAPTGAALTAPTTMKVAWNGKDKIYVYAVQAGSISAGPKHVPSATTVAWYEYDTFEVFMQSKIPATSIINKQTAYHYVFSGKFAVKGVKIGNALGLQTDAKMKAVYNTTTKKNTLEAVIPIKGAVKVAVAQKKPIFIKFGTCINNEEEVSVLGTGVKTSDPFWNTTNYLSVTLKK